MLPKSKIKIVKSLKHKKNRINSNLFIVEGVKSFNEVITSDYQIEFTVISEETFRSYYSDKKINDLYVVSSDEVKKLSSLHNNNSLISVVKKRKLENKLIDYSNPVIALDSINDPGNLGTIIRTADWFNIKSIICSRNTVDVYNSKVIQATMGSFTRVNVLYDDLENILESKDVKVYGTSTDGEDVKGIGKLTSGIILFGSESDGISDKLKRYVDRWISIKKGGSAESLNVSVSAGVILHKLT
ncbi:MAG: RNA methyltransferase [Flammeovirgaceae bacterium]|jgi:TrmH family RNA methyltransferase|nr:RNA methyltransferase [Flammeovirgaceae bacterium]|tara:strand:+ start:1985 stop:2713 length:729 start_codon:yes stop_codon:yes gene_type:complete